MKGYYDCGYDKLMQGVDPNDNDRDDAESEFYLVDDGFHGECSGCGYNFGPGELDDPTPIFVVEKSGKSPDTPDGPGEHWASGCVVCPGCNARLPYEMAS